MAWEALDNARAGEASSASGLRSFGLLGFAGAALGGIWLLISIWRDWREK
jgi:ubiquinone biosynthesis protein